MWGVEFCFWVWSWGWVGITVEARGVPREQAAAGCPRDIRVLLCALGLLEQSEIMGGHAWTSRGLLCAFVRLCARQPPPALIEERK